MYHSPLSWHNFSVNFRVIQFLLWAKGSHQSSNFDTFECSGENLPNSSCHFLSNKSVFPQIFHRFSMSWKISPLYFFSSNNIYFAQKELIKVKIFETFVCSGDNLSNSLCQFWNDKLIPLQILYPSSVLWEITPMYFLAQKIYNLLKRSLLKWKCLKLLSCQVKICQIPYVNFETTSRFHSKFCISLQFHDRYLLCIFLVETINIYFAQKEPIKIKNFETFKCSGQNSSISSCQLWNGKSVPLQILRNSSLSWQITPLWILSSYFFKFGLKDPIKIPILSALERNCHIPHIIFQTTSQLKVMLDL